MNSVDRLRSLNLFSPLDISLAQTCCRGESPLKSLDILAFTLCALSHMTFSQRHLCMEFSTLSNPAALFPELEERDWRTLDEVMPKIHDISLLTAFECIGSPDDSRKPVIIEGGRLYIQRYWFYEQWIAEKLLTYCRMSAEVAPSYAEIQALNHYFRESSEFPDPQIEAVQRAYSTPFSLISGGPGTGKTTIVAAILAWFYMKNPNGRAAVCAPTGKAQSRLSESLRLESKTLYVSDDIRERVASTPASTIHRLLNNIGRTVDDSAVLHVGLLVVDEVSMVAVEQLVRLFSVLSPDTRVILLGDKDQLASVENGTVLADICAAADENSVWKSHVTTLLRSHRFKSDSGIRELKDRVNAGDSVGTIQFLKQSHEDVKWIVPPVLKHEFSAFMMNYLNENSEFNCGPWCSNYDSVADAFEALQGFQILSAVRQGVRGVDALNLLVRRRLRKVYDRYFKGLPVMVTKNHYPIRLFNGDIGLCWPDEQGVLAVYFPDTVSESGFRRVPISLLPPHTDAFAMTIHKSQGSGFGHVLMILPDYDTPVLTRELLYTGITRAKSEVMICGGQSMISAGVARRTQRASGLSEKIVDISV